MECDQCGARRPRTGACPQCGAPAPGARSSMRQWKSQARTGQGPAVGRGRGAEAEWDDGSGSRRRGSGANWRGAGRGGWDDGAGYDEELPPARSGGRQGWPDQVPYGYQDYQEVPLERAVVPSGNDLMPMDPGMGMGVGLPAAPGMPLSDDEERALGVRRPVYIPATGEKRKRKLGTWRVVSGVLSILVVCVASCGLAGMAGRAQLERFLAGPVGVQFTPVVISTAGVPATPVGTPGPAGKYVLSIVTRSAVDQGMGYATSRFAVGSTVYVTVVVRGLPPGTHTISITWYLGTVRLVLPPNGLSEPATGDTQVTFGLKYSSPGIGMARIYVDRPASDNSDSPTDPYLAQSIRFAVLPPSALTPVPVTPSPVKSPSATPSKSPTASTHASAGSLSVAWRPGAGTA
jgi:hypothetical protein